MRPPFTITPSILDNIARIERLIGRIESLNQPKPQPHLRKSNRVRTVQGSLAIEGNTLELEQVTAILDGKRILGSKQEIQEVLNANATYDALESLDPSSSSDLLEAHRLMMQGVLPEAGRWRTGNVGIMKGSSVSHIAPKADRVPHLIDDLFAFLTDDTTHPLIRSCVFHYEFEFIHPFSDGNGRIGRFWQSLLLFHYHPVFEFIPVESLVRNNQKDYYSALEQSDHTGDSTSFIEFSLSMIRQALAEFVDELNPEPLTAEKRLQIARHHFGADIFSRKDYCKLFKTISTATASRDLKAGIENQLLHKQGDKAQTVYEYLTDRK